MSTSTRTVATPHRPLKQNVARRLIASVLRGELHDSWLVESDLAERFDVSRTPIREAIAELVRLGLAERYPNRGAHLLPLGPTQVREIYVVRGVLECEAVRLAATRIDCDELSRQLKDMRSLASKSTQSPRWASRAISRDQQLHSLICEAASNRRLAAEVARYYELVEAAREMLGRQYASQERALQEHIALAEALLARDADRAADEMRDHIRSAGEAVIAAFF